MIKKTIPSMLFCLMAFAGPLPKGWEIRYLLKLSSPETRPHSEIKWEEETETERAYLSVNQKPGATGGILVGRRIRIPENVSELELSATFQTYCANANRSGSVDLGFLPIPLWNTLGRNAQNASPPPSDSSWLLRIQIHKNREDVTSWETGRIRGKNLAPLASLAGQEVILVADWSTWHTCKEWFRLAELRLGETKPGIQISAWPPSVRIGSPVPLLVEVFGKQKATVELGWRTAKMDRWEWIPMAKGEAFFHQANLPAAVLDRGKVSCKARMKLAQGGEMETEERILIPFQPRTHPCVFYTMEMLAEMRQRIEQHEWARKTFTKIKKNADTWKQRQDEPPFGPGGWSHDYVCPEDGARLRWREDHPHDHICKRCGREWQGEKLDATWRNAIHGRLIRASRDCALAASITNDPKFATFPRRVLLWYGKNYRRFPEGRGPAGRGRVMSQSLTECSWLLQVMEAADLTFPFMTEEEKTIVETGLIAPGVQQISRFQFGIHNIQCWHNACMAAAGYFLGDQHWIERATNGKLGIKEQIKRGILADGLWFERSLGYHNYTLKALVTHCEIAAINGEDLRNFGRMQQMFTAPLRLSFPNLTTPSLNDQGYSRSPVGTYALEMAWNWYADQLAGSALRQRYAGGAPKGGLHLLKYNRELPAGDAYVSPGSVNMPGAGLAILRQGDANGVCAMLEYGEHGGGHGHPDKLQLILYGLGQTLCPDLGTTGYGVPLHGRWYKTTPGHNTVTIGRRNQRRTTGKLLKFQQGDGYAAVAAESAGAYKDWRLRRQLLLTEDFLLDIFTVEGGKEDAIDWFLRCNGQLETGLSLQTDDSEPPTATYGYLKKKRSSATDGQWACQWKGKNGSLHLTMAGVPGTRVVVAKAPGPAGSDPLDTLQVERRGTTTRFLAVYQFLPTGKNPQAVEIDADCVRIGTRQLLLPNDKTLLPALK